MNPITIHSAKVDDNTYSIQYTIPNKEKWWLFDYDVVVNNRVVKTFKNESIFANALNCWEELCGFDGRCYYPLLPHCPYGGNLHYLHVKKNKLFRAIVDNTGLGTVFEETEFSLSDEKFPYENPAFFRK